MTIESQWPQRYTQNLWKGRRKLRNWLNFLWLPKKDSFSSLNYLRRDEGWRMTKLFWSSPNEKQFFFKVVICKTISKGLFLQEKYNMQDHAELSFTEFDDDEFPSSSRSRLASAIDSKRCTNECDTRYVKKVSEITSYRVI